MGLYTPDSISEDFRRWTYSKKAAVKGYLKPKFEQLENKIKPHTLSVEKNEGWGFEPNKEMYAHFGRMGYFGKWNCRRTTVRKRSPGRYSSQSFFTLYFLSEVDKVMFILKFL